MLKNLVAVVALVVGFSWAAAVPAAADHTPELDVVDEVDATFLLRTYDLDKQEDWCSLLVLIFGWDGDA